MSVIGGLYVDVIARVVSHYTILAKLFQNYWNLKYMLKVPFLCLRIIGPRKERLLILILSFTTLVILTMIFIKPSMTRLITMQFSISYQELSDVWMNFYLQ